MVFVKQVPQAVSASVFLAVEGLHLIGQVFKGHFSEDDPTSTASLRGNPKTQEQQGLG
jgi:hypothetical protein